MELEIGIRVKLEPEVQMIFFFKKSNWSRKIGRKIKGRTGKTIMFANEY